MTKKLTEIFFIVALFVFFSFIAGCVQHYSDVKGKIRKGQSKQTIIELLGKPLEKKTIYKRKTFGI
jgi:outer membrane protein assembly factor BamE (lipoprotein component of BamABCDE complex)